MTIKGVLYEDTLVTTSNAPGYRDLGIYLDLNDGTGRKRRVEVRLTAEDSARLLASLLDIHRRAWDLGEHRENKPLDVQPGEPRPSFLP